MALRFTLPAGTGDVPPITAARRLGLTLDAFLEKLPLLLEHGFPPPDPITGNYDLDAIDRWRRRRHPLLFGDQLTPPPAPAARDAKDVVAERIARLRGDG
jgi:hypothetical protein